MAVTPKTFPNALFATSPKEAEGAWIIHHGQKIAMDANGSAEFPSIDQAAKATSLIVALAGTNDDSIPLEKVKAIGRAARLNPKRELQNFLNLLEDKRLIEQTGTAVNVLGLTHRAALQHAADMFAAEEPEANERAAIELAELTSIAPQSQSELAEYIGDTYRFSKLESADFIRRAEEIGFVDCEGESGSKLVFNGNLFRRDSVVKAKRVLNSLSSPDESKVTEFDQILRRSGCVMAATAQRVMGDGLLNKLMAAGMYEIHTVHNDAGEHLFVTSPAAFHKFVNPMIDDAFNLAKALVAALTYGMTRRSGATGRIQSVDVLLHKLISGRVVGPATAIGQDYRVLEEKRVLEIIPNGNLFSMRLIKTEVGEIALQVLQQGDATASIVDAPPAAPMSGYTDPEGTRWAYRKRQGTPSRKATYSIIEALRSGRKI